MVKGSGLASLLTAILAVALGFTASCTWGRLPLDPGGVAPEPEAISVAHHVAMQPVDIVLIIDQSGSMSGYRGFPPTDPRGWRVEAGRYLISNLAVKTAPEAVARLGIVHFGTTAPRELVVPLRELDSTEAARRMADELEALNLGWTNFLDAFQQADRLFQEAGTFEQGRQAVVITFTDGEPQDERRLHPERYFSELDSFLGRYRENAVDLFVVGIDAVDLAWSQYRGHWEHVLPTADSAVMHLESLDDLPRVFNDVVRLLYEIPDIAPDVVSEAEAKEFELPAYLEGVEFHIFAENRDLQLSITRPDGTVVREADKDVSVENYDSFSIIVVAAPEPGVWRYRIDEGWGRVEVYRNMIPVLLHLISPRPEEILGVHRPIRVGFSHHDATPIVVRPDYPIQIEMSIVCPSGSVDHCILYPEAPGLYVCDELFTAQAAGVHVVELTIHAAGAFTQRAAYQVTVKELPYLASVRPLPDQELRAGRDLEVEVAVKMGSDEVDPTPHFDTPPTALVVAWMETDEGERLPAHYLHPLDASGRLGATLPHPVPQGPAVLKMRVVGNLPDGSAYIGDDLTVGFRGTVPWWVVAWPWALTLLLMACAVSVVSYLRRPTWEGRLVIEHPEEESREIDLSRFGRRRQVTVGVVGDITLADPAFPELVGRMELSQTFTDLGPRDVPCVYYRASAGDAESSQLLVYDGDFGSLGPFTLRYYWQ